MPGGPVHIVSRKRLREFAASHPNAERPLDDWYRTVRSARWATLAEVRATYPHADVYGCCTIFNIAGNNFRLIAWINYRYQRIFVRAVLTHAEYDREAWKDDCDPD
jgi:mRNA interferase HigB